jgi:hypothetical protein
VRWGALLLGGSKRCHLLKIPGAFEMDWRGE